MPSIVQEWGGGRNVPGVLWEKDYGSVDFVRPASMG